MNPFFFGETGQVLYGVHHPPRGTTPRSAGIVLCYPFAQEYMRAHRAFRQLSLLLSGEGFHVLRFDYSGTGDSAGEPSDMSLDRWSADLDIAIDELMDTAAVDSVWVVGLRLGGTVALGAAGRPGVEGIVLWDPIVAGVEQLSEAVTERDALGAATLEVGGIPIAPAMQRELNELHLLRGTTAPRVRTLLAVSADEPRYRELEQWLSRSGSDVKVVCIPSDGRWSYFDNWGSALIPQGLIRAIVDYLKGVVR